MALLAAQLNGDETGESGGEQTHSCWFRHGGEEVGAVQVRVFRVVNMLIDDNLALIVDCRRIIQREVQRRINQFVEIIELTATVQDGMVISCIADNLPRIVDAFAALLMP